MWLEQSHTENLKAKIDAAQNIVRKNQKYVREPLDYLSGLSHNILTKCIKRGYCGGILQVLGINYYHEGFALKCGMVPLFAAGSTHMGTSQMIGFVLQFPVLYMSLAMVLKVH